MIQSNSLSCLSPSPLQSNHHCYQILCTYKHPRVKIFLLIQMVAHNNTVLHPALLNNEQYILKTFPYWFFFSLYWFFIMFAKYTTIRLNQNLF